VLSPKKGGSRRVALAPAALGFPVLIATMIVLVEPSIGQEHGDAMPPGAYERLAFDAADTDGDGFVSEAELARDAAAGFSGLDKDRSGSLTPEELGPHDATLFALVDGDGDGDGVLTFDEIIDHKAAGFEKADRDGDGLVSFGEMVDEAKSELGVP
jgi:Ca2+-binding EF-hand superfamily protein